TVAELSAIDADTSGTVTYGLGVKDQASALAANTNSYVTGSYDVSVTDAGTVAELSAIDVDTTGTVTYGMGLKDQA
ncbi:hypothetical protein, partial [Magnetococcus sp. PR-3]